MGQRCALFACLVSWVLAQPVALQLESAGAIDPFNFWEDSSQDETNRSSLNTADGETEQSTHRERHGSGGLGGRQGNNGAHGFGSVCSLENQCNELLGLACIRYGNRGSQCACAPSTPVYVSEGGAEKCVRPKELHEACVSDRECSYKNPNVQCISFICNCSAPFELTPERLCQLPSGVVGNIFTTAVSVMLALALLLVVGGYVYQRKLRERERSSSLSAKPGLSVHADTSSTSSTTLILGRGRPWGDKAESREESYTRQGYYQAGRLRTRSELSLPLHQPRYVSHKDAGHEVAWPAAVGEGATLGETGLSTVPECCSVAERSSPSASHCVFPCSLGRRPRTGADTPLQQTLEQQGMVGHKTRETGSQRNGDGNSPPIQMLLPGDERIRRILNEHQEVVVTVETHKHKRCLRTESSLPPVVWIPRRQPPPSELADDSLIKDLKRWRRVLSAGRPSDDLSVTTNTVSERRSASTSAAAGAQSDALLRSSAPPPTAVRRVPDATHPPGMVFGAALGACGSSAAVKPTQQRNAAVEPVKNQRETPEAATKAVADDHILSVVQKAHVALQLPVPPRIRDANSSKDREENRTAEGSCYSTKRTSFSAHAGSTACGPDVETNALPSSPEARLRHVDQREQNAMKTGAQQGTVSAETHLDSVALVERSNKSESKIEVGVSTKDISRDFLHHCVETQTALNVRALQDTKSGAGLTEVMELKADCPKPDSTSEDPMHAVVKQRLNSNEKVSKNAIADLPPTPIGAPKTPCSSASLLQEDEHLRIKAKTSDPIQAQRLEIEQIGQIAGRLSSVIGEPAEKARAQSLEDSTNSDVRPLLTTYTCLGDANHTQRSAAMNAPDCDRKEERAALTKTDVERGVETQGLPAQAKGQGSLTDQRSQNACRQFMAMKLEPPVHFTERPLADVLASLDSEMTSIAKDERKGGICRQKAPSEAIPKPPGARGLQYPTQYDMNDEDLCEAAIERSSGEGTESFSRGLAFIYKTKASAATPPKRPVRFLGPLSSRNIVVLPESSVAICLPEGTSRDDLWTAASGTSLRQSFAAGGSGLRHRHLFLASTLEDPTFESIYNAILLPQLVAQEASGESGDVPSSRPARSTSSSRAVSFDNSPTVMPLEPPPDPFAPCDASKEPASPPPIIRPRRRSSVCLSSSGSLVQEMTEAAELRAVLGSRHALRRRPSVLPDPESAYDCNGSAESPVLEAADLSW